MFQTQIFQNTSFKITKIITYFKFYGLDREKLSFAKSDALVMHPGPINRGVEIDSELADDINRTLILEQVELGVAIRMSVIEHLINNLEHKND